jgi:PAS domain S-box-containing protein
MTEEPSRAIWPVVVVTDLTGRVTYWNAAAEEVLGWTAGEAIGQAITDLCLPAENLTLLAQILHQVGTGDPWQGRLGLRDRAGRALELATVELPIIDGRGQLVGVLGMSVPEGVGRADQVAARAQARAQLAADRLGRLQRISAALSRRLSTDGVCDVILAELVAEVGITRRVLWLLDARYDLALARAIGSDIASGFAHMAADADLAAPVAARTGTPVFIESAEEGRRRFPAIGQLTDRSYAALPLLVDGIAIGVLGLGVDRDHRFDEDERRYLMAIADQAAQAFERARLLERETRAAGRLAFLAHASVVLASSLEHEETLSQVVRLMVPSVADLATVHLYDRRGNLQRSALAHRDPTVEANIRRYQDPRGYEERSALLAAAAMRGGSLLIADASDVLTPHVTLDDEHGRILGSLHITSALVVPLMARGASLGMLSLMRVDDSPPFEIGDQDFTEEVGRRAAIAIDNARLHASRVAVLQSLQRSLLPPQLPRVPHMELAAAYHPAAEGVDVGGDFYDVFPLVGEDDGWAVIIGDVCGTGAVAAARTGQVRHTVRAVVRAGLRSRDVLVSVNAALLADGEPVDDGERFCTLLYGEARVSSGGVDLALVSGGHPAPIVVRAGGEVAAVDCRGSLLGVFKDILAERVEVRLEPGDSAVLFTDGIVEARSERPGEDGLRGFFDDDRLVATLQESAGADAAAQVAAVEKAVLTYTGGTLADDAAVLVLRAAPR